MHIHNRMCYDDSEPGREPQLICNNGEGWPDDKEYRELIELRRPPLDVMKKLAAKYPPPKECYEEDWSGL